MTFEEITDYLNRTVFSPKKREEIYQKNVEGKFNKYHRNSVKWYQKQSHSLYLILDTIVSCEKYQEEMVMVIFCPNKKQIGHLVFTTFFYRNNKYVAFHLNDNKIWYFSWHSIKRYAERFLNDKDADIDYEFISEMLVYNGYFYKTNYEYQGKLTNMFVTLDGGFLCDEFNNYIIARTFISEKEYFENQKELDLAAFDNLRKCIKDDFGYWLMRG